MNEKEDAMPRAAVPVYVVEPGDSVTAWIVAPLVEAYFPGIEAPAEDRVNYRFINGFVDVGDLPCRKAFLNEMVGRNVTPPGNWENQTLTLPGANRRVEFTDFWHVPTHVSRWLRGRFQSATDRQVAFRLKTCGGIRIWVNGEEQIRFEPFKRNSESRTDILLSLLAGDNTILVLTEDLAERDTNWFFELELVDPQPLSVVLPVELDRDEVARLERLIGSIRPARDVFVDEPLELVVDEAPGKDLPVTVAVQSLGHEKATIARFDLVLGAAETRLIASSSVGVPDGYHNLRITAGSGAGTVTRTISAAFLGQLTAPAASPSLAQRKAEALAHGARFGAARIGTVFAMLATDTIDPSRMSDIVEATLRSIDAREDCSDFIMVPLLWILSAYREKLSPALELRIRAAVQDYRYWVDEPGNDTMWFWSENHVLCFHTNQLLAGQLMPDAVFSASGRSGRQQADLAAARLEKWFDSVEAHGLAEWNSAAYYPVDFIGLFALQHLAPAPIDARAERLLDLIFQMIALHSLNGVPAGSQGRAYDKELRAGPLTELAPFVRVAFGHGWLNGGVASLPLFAAGSYQPPANLADLAQLAEGRTIEARYAQGLEMGKLVLFKTQASQLSTVVDHKTGRPGHQQHVVDLRLAGHPMARLWINHPGEDDPWGSQRPSYWAGNGILPRVAQHRDVAMLIFDGHGARVPWTHAYVPRDILDEVLIKGNWLIVRSGTGFAALYATNGFVFVETGATAGTEIRSEGAVAGWVAVVGTGDETAFARFSEEVVATGVSFDASARRLRVTPPDRQELSLSYEGELCVGGDPRPFVDPQPAPLLTYDSAVSSDEIDMPFFNRRAPRP